jgi:hypothetical protein
MTTPTPTDAAKEKATRKRLLDSRAMILDQTAIIAGFAFRR